MKKILAILALSGTAFLLPACNTVDGAGEDLESVADCADGVAGNC